MDIPITAMASGSLKPERSQRGPYAGGIVLTRKIEEAGVLMELVEDIAASVLDVCCCYNSNSAFG